MLFLFKKIGAAVMAVALLGCATPRTGSVFKLDFADQAPTALMRVECNGEKKVVQGVFACEEKEPSIGKIQVKILPTPGQVIYSDGLRKEVEDFNWAESGFWIFKSRKINDTWISLDPGELRSIFGDTPLAFNVTGMDKESGVIVNRGVFYHRWCNDRDIPCSKMIVNYDCAGQVKNTWPGQIGYCSRMSGSSQKFSIPLKTLKYHLPEGARVRIKSNRSGWTYQRDLTSSDIDRGELKVEMPEVYNGPNLISFQTLYRDQGVPTDLQTDILISGFDPAWTGIDNPHWLSKKKRTSNSGSGFKFGGGLKWYMPVMSDLLEVYDYEDGDRKIERKNSTTTGKPEGIICAYAWQRVSGALSYTCLDKSLKEVDHPTQGLK